MSSTNNRWILTKTVLPQHTDHAGVMWHGSYLRWLEEARIDALSSVGLAYSNLSNEGYEMPVVEMKIKYLIPLFHGDHVTLKSWVFQDKLPRLHWETKFFKDSSKPLVIAKIDLVLIKKDSSSSRLYLSDCSLFSLVKDLSKPSPVGTSELRDIVTTE